MSDTVPPVTEQPATIPLGQAPDLRTYEDARAKGLSELPNPQAQAAADDEPVDDETAAEIDKLEKPADNETPQSRAARRRKHREAARKALVTKAQNERDEVRGRLTAAEAELAEWREGKRATTPPTNGASPAKVDAPASEFTRPKPTLRDFPLEKFKDEDDPYAARDAALAEALIDWKHEQREHAATQSRQREQADQDIRQTLKSHGDREAEAKTRLSDYDAVVGAASFQRTPATPALLDLVFRSDVSADVVYHLAKNRDVTARLLQSPNRDALLMAFAEVQATVKAALSAAKAAAASPKVTSAAEPLAPITSGSGNPVVSKSPKDMTLREWEERRAAERGGRR